MEKVRSVFTFGSAQSHYKGLSSIRAWEEKSSGMLLAKLGHSGMQLLERIGKYCLSSSPAKLPNFSCDSRKAHLSHHQHLLVISGTGLSDGMVYIRSRGVSRVSFLLLLVAADTMGVIRLLFHL